MSALLDIAHLSLASTPNEPPVSAAPTAVAPSPPDAIPTAQAVARILDGHETQVSVQSFSDRVFVLVTQLGRIGSLIQINPPPFTLPPPVPSTSTSLFPSLPTPHPSSTLFPIFGVPPSPHLEALYDLYAGQIGAIVFQLREGEDELSKRRPVLLGIALKGDKESEEGGISEEERKTFGQVMEMVRECEVW